MAEQKATWDVAIIGGGGAGLAVAAACLESGQRVVLFERDAPGGSLRQDLATEALLAAARGAALSGRVPAMPRQAEAAGGDLLAPFRARGLEVVPASAHFIAPDRLEAAGRSYPFRNAVIAAGRAPLVPDLYGLAAVPWLTPESLPVLEESPEHLLILGGEAEAVEIAQAHALLGRRVSLVTPEPNILPGQELELVVPLREALRRAGVTLHENAAVLTVEHAGAGVALLLEGGARLEGSHLVLAMGHAPRLAPLDLPAGQVEATARGVTVREDLRSTTNRRVWAAGWAADTGLPAAAAGQHAAVVADGMLRGLRARLSQVAPPRLVRSLPALAQLSMTEAEARAAGHDPQLLRVPLPDGLFGLEQAKLVADRQGRLLGAAVLAERAGEVAALLALAADQGLTGAEIAALPLPHGTLAASIARAAGNLRGTEFPSPPMRRILGVLDRWK
ncbi:FAD-dependent oxidoreductase [Roseomonas marmotae]|uniref:FAD-dependent oxidoreductase n=1 Tax=Roseomonas marmotae TaxID=2768161 RepID=A0ABS3KFF5_9PROT|nr:FAD-dependent oxidoreductase [Roseomonas marmotae]MBO1075378.1 FAD-dependent oxidoreductase [Roseomonas marmotae]QTI78367.1 FAD-dependent oxidoreductase [Roseomonas marmotae]